MPYLLLTKYNLQFDYGNIIEPCVKYALPLDLWFASLTAGSHLAGRGGNSQALGEVALILGGPLENCDNHACRPSPRKEPQILQTT